MYVHIKLRLKEVNASTTVRPAFPNKNNTVNDAKRIPTMSNHKTKCMRQLFTGFRQQAAQKL